jgi:hypothetical protein
MTPFRPTLLDLERRDNPQFTPEQVFDAAATVRDSAPVLTYLQERPDLARAGNAGPQLFALADVNRTAGNALLQFMTELRQVIAATPRPTAEQVEYAGRSGFLAFRGFEIAAQAEQLAARIGASRPPEALPTDGSALLQVAPAATGEGLQNLGNGLQIRDRVVGTGDAVPANATVLTQYRGFLASTGAEFDTSVGREPFSANLNGGVIQGFSQGLVGARVGGIRQLFIPAALGYGAAGSPPSIPADADLIFEVQVLAITSGTGTNGSSTLSNEQFQQLLNSQG